MPELKGEIFMGKEELLIKVPEELIAPIGRDRNRNANIVKMLMNFYLPKKVLSENQLIFLRTFRIDRQKFAKFVLAVEDLDEQIDWLAAQIRKFKDVKIDIELRNFPTIKFSYLQERILLNKGMREDANRAAKFQEGLTAKVALERRARNERIVEIKSLNDFMTVLVEIYDDAKDVFDSKQLEAFFANQDYEPGPKEMSDYEEWKNQKDFKKGE